MTYEEIVAKVEGCKQFSVAEIKDIPHGRSLRLSNGGIINCYNSGSYVIQGKAQEEVRSVIEGSSISDGKKIFVVYGHDEIARTQLEAMLRRWDLEPIILDQQASGGQTIIEKLEVYAANVGYAIILATPDDEGKAKSELNYKSRVRQNVVLELGMFLAKLGRKRVAILWKEATDFEKPSDIDGLIYIPFKDKVDEGSVSLIRELSRQGYRIDSGKI